MFFSNAMFFPNSGVGASSVVALLLTPLLVLLLLAVGFLLIRLRVALCLRAGGRRKVSPNTRCAN